MKRAIFERLTPKNRKNVPKFTKLSPTGGLRLQERMLLRNFEGKDARISGRDEGLSSKLITNLKQ